MFKTLVIACALGDVSQCIQFEDSRGPYLTEQQCQSRAYEMANSIREIHQNNIQPVRFKCVKLKGEML
jgi:hypothetical protein